MTTPITKYSKQQHINFAINMRFG